MLAHSEIHGDIPVVDTISEHWGSDCFCLYEGALLSKSPIPRGTSHGLYVVMFIIADDCHILITFNIAGASPFEIPATDDLESVKVVPNPSRCLGRRKPLVFRLGK